MRSEEILSLMCLVVLTSSCASYPYIQERLDEKGSVIYSINHEGFRKCSGDEVLVKRGTWEYMVWDGRRLRRAFWGGFGEASCFAEGLARVRNRSFASMGGAAGRWGFIDRQGNLVVDYKFEEADFFSGGLAAVQYGGLWGLIDRTGKFVIEPKFMTSDSVRQYYRENLPR